MATNLYLVHHNYDAEKDDELTLAVGDIISVSDNSDPGWWVGEKVKGGQAGWFPANFVDPYEESAAAAPAPADPIPAAPTTAAIAAPVQDDSVTAPAAESAAPPAPKHEGPVLARVEYDYEAKESGELSLEVGRVVTILDSSDPAWWTGDLNGKVGTFPSNYVKLLEHKEESTEAGDKPAKFRLAAFGVKQGGLGSLFAGGVVPGLKKTGGLKKVGGVSEPAAPVGGIAKRTSVDEPRSPVVAAAPPKISPPVAEEVVAPLIAHHTPARATPPAPATPPVPVEEPIIAQEPRVPSRAKKPKAKQIKAVVVYDYTAQEDDEVTLIKGTTIVVTDKMGDEGWWCGRNEQGEVGNFPSDFVEEIKEEVVQSPIVAPAAPVPVPAPIAVPAPAPVVPEEAPKSPVHSRPPIHAPVPLPAIPAEPLRAEPVRTRTNETPLATPPAFPRGSRPPSMISSPTPSSAQLHDVRGAVDGPPLPSSPPPKRMSSISRTSSHDVPASPRLASPRPASALIYPNPEVSSPTSTQPPSGDLSRSSTMRRPQKPVPEAPLTEAEEAEEAPIVAETPEPPTSNSNRNSYILPTPVARNRPLPPLARPPSIHSTTENRKSVVASPPVTHLPPVPAEQEEPEPIQEEEAVEEQKVHHEPEAPVPEEEEEEAVEHKDEVEEEVVSHEPKAEEQEEDIVAVAAAVEEAVEEEKEPEKPKLPEFESTGPALSHVSRPRPAKGRKPPSAPIPAETSSFVAQLEAEVKAAPVEEVKKPEPVPAPVVEKAAPPPKPVKPIFQKFPTPFAGASPASISLRPTGRRTESGNEGPLSPGSSSSSSGSPATAPTPAGGVAPPPGGVKSLSSRFGQFQGVPASGGNSAALELEIAKLRRWMTEELDRVKRELSDERESREKLQEEVNQLKAQLQG
ncbi:SH3-domain kinase binding protein 1 [Linnemannia zychae]|nr:SH3-domain kinase binding protein 1 [Linnemannia zychae]